MVNFIFNQLAVLPLVADDIFILLVGDAGVYFLGPGVVISFAKAIADAWVLLVEINR